MRLLFRMDGFTVYFKTEEKKEKGGEREREREEEQTRTCAQQRESSHPETRSPGEQQKE